MRHPGGHFIAQLDLGYYCGWLPSAEICAQGLLPPLWRATSARIFIARRASRRGRGEARGGRRARRAWLDLALVSERGPRAEPQPGSALARRRRTGRAHSSRATRPFAEPRRRGARRRNSAAAARSRGRPFARHASHSLERRAVPSARPRPRAALCRRQHGLDVEQAEARDLARRALDAVRVGDARAEHLIAAADAQHVPAAAHVGGEVDVPALRAKEGEVGDRRLGAGQDDEIGDRQGLAGAARRRAARPAPGAADRNRRNWRCAGSSGTAIVRRRRRARRPAIGRAPRRLRPAGARPRRNRGPGRRRASRCARRSSPCRRRTGWRRRGTC